MLTEAADWKKHLNGSHQLPRQIARPLPTDIWVLMKWPDGLLTVVLIPENIFILT